MKPPKCKVCGEEEWQHVCGPPKLTIEEITRVVSASKPFKDLKDRIENPPETALERYLTGKSRFDRVAYQREYMRKWRANKPKS